LLFSRPPLLRVLLNFFLGGPAYRRPTPRPDQECDGSRYLARRWGRGTTSGTGWPGGRPFRPTRSVRDSPRNKLLVRRRLGAAEPCIPAAPAISSRSRAISASVNPDPFAVQQPKFKLGVRAEEFPPGVRRKPAAAARVKIFSAWCPAGLMSRPSFFFFRAGSRPTAQKASIFHRGLLRFGVAGVKSELSGSIMSTSPSRAGRDAADFPWP